MVVSGMWTKYIIQHSSNPEPQPLFHAGTNRRRHMGTKAQGAQSSEWCGRRVSFLVMLTGIAWGQKMLFYSNFINRLKCNHHRSFVQLFFISI